jgi:hypothetical protein
LEDRHVQSAGFPVDKPGCWGSIRGHGDSDLPMRRHAQASRPVFREGRSTPTVKPPLSVESNRPSSLSRQLRLTDLPAVGLAGWRSFATVWRFCVSAIGVFVLTLGMSTGLSSIAQGRPIDLSNLEIGGRPEQFAFWRSGQIDLGHWAIVGDAASPGGAAIQRSDTDGSVQAALAVYTPLSALNATIQTRFKLVDGSMPSAGVALRVTGPDDYYLVRASSYEQRVSLLHVVHGTAEEVAGVDADVSKAHWQTLEVLVLDNEFTISLDDRWVLTAFDRKGLTVGQFGIWTERDNVTRFDQIEISPPASGLERSWGLKSSDGWRLLGRGEPQVGR